MYQREGPFKMENVNKEHLWIEGKSERYCRKKLKKFEENRNKFEEFVTFECPN